MSNDSACLYMLSSNSQAEAWEMRDAINSKFISFHESDKTVRLVRNVSQWFKYFSFTFLRVW